MTESQRVRYRIKNLIERFVAAGSLVVLSPFLGLLALAVRCESAGPAFFKQDRVGLAGRNFRLWKLRSMVVDADRRLTADGEPIGNRVTRVGRWLRRTSLDELPQLWNIVRGDMAFVGPRPILREHLARCQNAPDRHAVLPGVTGLAQISGRNTLPWSRRIELDQRYAESYSIGLDLWILWRTVHVVLGAEGVVLDRNPGQVDDLLSEPDDGTTVHNGRREPVMRGKHAKDAHYERFLTALNDSLADAHDAHLDDSLPAPPVVHVIGSPRSGTTLATQLLASGLDLGYVDNLTAAFWRAPVYGMRLSRRLIPDRAPSTFRSECGRTQGIEEPHEFGYFWSNLLGYAEMKEPPAGREETIDWDRFRIVLSNLSAAAGRPMVFKPFLLAWHMRRAVEAMPATLFVWVRRDPVDTAMSILRTRRELLGDEAGWTGVKPHAYQWLREEPPEVQAAGQVWFYERAIEQQAAGLSSESLITVEHSQMLASPAGFIEGVKEKLSDRGIDFPSLREPPPPFSQGKDRDDTATRQRVREAFERFARKSQQAAA